MWCITWGCVNKIQFETTENVGKDNFCGDFADDRTRVKKIYSMCHFNWIEYNINEVSYTITTVHYTVNLNLLKRIAVKR